MQITFHQAVDAGAARLVARIVEQDKLPDDLERPLAEGARAARFSGKTGQLFEGFVGARRRGDARRARSVRATAARAPGQAL
jgi:leucyl aminopeptidase